MAEGGATAALFTSALPRDRLTTVAGTVIVALAGTVSLGIAVATDNAPVALAVLVGCLAVVGFVAAYLLRPIPTVLWFWVFLLIQDTASTALGKTFGAGAMLNKAESPFLVLLFVLSFLQRRKARACGGWLLYAPAIGFLVVGLLSSLSSPAPFSVTLLGAFLGVKAYLAFAIAVWLPWTLDDVERVLRWILLFALPIAILAFVDFLAPEPFRTLLHLPRESDVRLGMESARSIFPNPALLASFMFLTLAAVLGRIAFIRRRIDLVAISLLCPAAVLTLRLKALLGIAAAFATATLVARRSLFRNLGAFALVGVGGLSVIAGIATGVAARQVATYAATETPRDRLLSTSIRIAEDRFPLGAGFGRYGSAPSEQPYSTIYDQYGLSGIPGLSREDPAFLHDTSWPTILGETGLLGMACYCAGLIALGLRLLRQARDVTLDPRARAASLAAVASLSAFAFDSAGRPALFDAFTVLSVGLFVGAALVLGRPPPGKAEGHQGQSVKPLIGRTA